MIPPTIPPSTAPAVTPCPISPGVEGASRAVNFAKCAKAGQERLAAYQRGPAEEGTDRKVGEYQKSQSARRGGRRGNGPSGHSYAGARSFTARCPTSRRRRKPLRSRGEPRMAEPSMEHDEPRREWSRRCVVLDWRWPCYSCPGTQCPRSRCWCSDRLVVERLVGIDEQFVGWPRDDLGPGERHLDRRSELVVVNKQWPRHPCARAKPSGHRYLAIRHRGPRRRCCDSEQSLVEPSLGPPAGHWTCPPKSLGLSRCRLVS